MNWYAYCYGNPVRYADPSGNIPVDTLIDFASCFFSLNDLIHAPSWENFGYLAWDIGSLLVPYIPGSYVGDIGKASLNLIDYAADAQRAVKAAKVASEASVWAMDAFKRGWAIESMLGGFCTNFKTLDYYEIVNAVRDERGLTYTITNAISIKSIDLTATTYQDSSKLYNKLKGYVDDLYDFTKTPFAGAMYELAAGSTKTLVVAIPPSGISDIQREAFDRLVNYVNDNDLGIEIVIKIVE